MKKIGLISDTHNYFDDRFHRLFADVDEIWHAGDVGDMATLEAIRRFKPLRAVYGNIDGTEVRHQLKETERFTCEGADILMTHIGGYPGRYEPRILEIMRTNAPAVFIAGHSHILKVIYDKKYSYLHLNPGACGLSGFHTIRTALRFAIDGGEVKQMEILELGARRQ
ncbi:MAG: metallophosphoesterase family protein [Bacteroidales bacterium]|nr:metallophosphoesterase family protein [Bacteroidales bacterium]